MSVKAVKFVRELTGLTVTEKAVAFVLAAHDDQNGAGSWPSMTTVARESGLRNRETASRIAKRLIEKDILIPHEQAGKPTVYHFNYASKPVTPRSRPPVTRESHLPVTGPVTLGTGE